MLGTGEHPLRLGREDDGAEGRAAAAPRLAEVNLLERRADPTAERGCRGEVKQAQRGERAEDRREPGEDALVRGWVQKSRQGQRSKAERRSAWRTVGGNEEEPLTMPVKEWWRVCRSAKRTLRCSMPSR